MPVFLLPSRRLAAFRIVDLPVLIQSLQHLQIIHRSVLSLNHAISRRGYTRVLRVPREKITITRDHLREKVSPKRTVLEKEYIYTPRAVETQLPPTSCNKSKSLTYKNLHLWGKPNVRHTNKERRHSKSSHSCRKCRWPPF